MRPRIAYRHRVWWTRERVVDGLLRLFREKGEAPTNDRRFAEITGALGAPSGGSGRTRQWPSRAAVYKHFPGFRHAWEAAGVTLDRNGADWTPIEDWYLREASGLITREEIARDTGRTPQAVHTRLGWLGVYSYDQHGWTLNRIERVTGVPHYLIRDRYLLKGRIPFDRGTRCFYLDPADLLDVVEIDWSNPPVELERAARRSLLSRIVSQLEGVRLPTREEACAASLAKYQPVQRPGRRYQQTILRSRIAEELSRRGLVSVNVAAERLGLHHVTLRRRLYAGVWPSEHVPIGRTYVVGVRLPSGAVVA